MKVRVVSQSNEVIKPTSEFSLIPTRGNVICIEGAKYRVAEHVIYEKSNSDSVDLEIIVYNYDSTYRDLTPLEDIVRPLSVANSRVPA